VRFLKWVSLGLGAIIALALIGVLVIVWLVDPNTFKPRIQAAVRDATGREFTLVGDIELDFFPWLALRTGEGRFGNAAGFGPGPMVTWKSAQVGAKLFPLLRGELVADQVVLDEADVRLVRHADGTANWQGIGGGKPADPKAKPMELHIDGVEIRNSRISFVDESVPRTVVVSAFNFETDEIAPGEPLTDTEVSGVLQMDGFATEGVPFKARLPRVVAPRDFSSIEIGEYSLGFGRFEAEGAVKGALGEHPALEGKFATNRFDPRALLLSVGIAPPKTTDPTALSKVKLEGGWRFNDGALSLEPFSLAVDDTQFQGFFRRGAGEDALGEFALRGNAIDLSRYIPPSDPNSEPFVMPTAALKALKFRGDLELEQAKLGDVEMKGVALRLLLDDQGLRTASPERAQ
jgi:AsmA protein